MNLFVFLIVWWAIFNENQTKLIENNDIKSDTPRNDTNNKPTEMSNHPTPKNEFSSENKRRTKTEPNTRNETENNSNTMTTKRYPYEKKDYAVSEPKEDDERIEKPSAVPHIMAPRMSSQPIIKSTPHDSDIKPQTPKAETINLPIYALIIIMFAMAIMFFIIMALLFILYKINQGKRHRDSMDVSIQPTNDVSYKYVRQLSGETSNASTLLKDRTKNSKLAITRNDNKALLFKNLDTIDATKVNDKTSTLTIPQSKPSAKGRPLTRILKQPTANHIPISREQMFELCKGVLSKTKKSIEATSLSELEKISKESRNEENFEKCLSTPELDLDMYVVPTSSSRKFFNSDDGKNEEFNEVYDKLPNNQKKCNYPSNKNKKEETDDEVYDNPLSNKHDYEVFDDGVYDNPPPKHNRKRNIVVSTDHEDYVMPLTGDNGLYCNAKYCVDNKIRKNSL